MSGFEIELPSSPDPLGDESIVIPPGSVAPPPPSTTRRPFQSAASSRFSAIPGTSPRKRMFALDVGNEITPQTIYVTVEAGPDGNPITKPGRASVGGANVRRLLFGSPTPQPSPRRGARTTTTTVPLRGLTDDEGDPTPRRRRRSSTRPGTPATAGAKRKKKGTPTPKPRGRPRGTPVASSDALQSEAPATVEKPTPARRGRPPKRKAETAPSDQDSHAPPEASTKKKPGRKRQKSIQADDTDELTTAGIDIAPPQSYDRHSSQDIDDTNQHVPPEEAHEDGGAAQQEEGDEEAPFLAQLSDPPRDMGLSSTAEPAMEPFEPLDEPRFERQHSQLEDQGPLPGESDDYAPMMDFDDRSDVDSHRDAPVTSDTQAKHGTLELEDQGPLPGESDDYAPMMDRDDESDVRSRHSEATPRASRDIRHEPLELEDQGPLPGESEDYAPMMDVDDKSDAESHRSFQPERSEDGTDNAVDPDTFTMIGIETMPSFQGNRGAPTSDLPEIGETTSLLINKTLESLRQEMDTTDDEIDDVDLLGSREQTPVEAGAQSAHEISSGRKRSPPKSSHVQDLRARQSAEVSQAPRAGTSLEHTALEFLQGNTHSPAQPIREQDNNKNTGVNSDELNADDDSFSDIPEEVFAAVEPQEMPHPASASEDELSMAVVPAQISAPESIHSQETIPFDSQDNEVAEDPQSPRDHLERSHADHGDSLRQSSTRFAPSGKLSTQATQKSSQPHPTRSRSDSNRLLTPPDEPTSSSDQSIPATNQPNEEQNVFADSDDEIGSSPPEITTFDREDEQPMQDSRRSSDTPTNRPPSIHLQPVQAREANAAIFSSHSAGPRPFLSPIVRVGERLQNILSDPPSPSARSSVLGSPFKGSVRKSSLDAPSDEEAVHRDTSSNATLQNPPAAPESPPKPTWTQSLFSLSHLKTLVTEGTKRLTSPQVNITQTWEDPFGPSSPSKDRGGSGRNSAFMERIRQASREGSVHSSRASVARATLGEVDDRSFSGDPAPRGLSSNWRGERSQKSGLLGSGVIPGQCHVGRLGGSAVAVDKEPEAAAVDRRLEEPRTDDTLLQPVEHQAAETESIRYPQLGDEVVQGGGTQKQPKEDAMQVDDAPPDEDGSDDDIWAIEADRTASSPTAQKRANESINESFNAFARSGLSIDWGTRSTISQTLPAGRSPAFKQSMRGGLSDMRENLEDYSLLDLHSGTDTQPSAKKPTPEQKQEPKRVDLSDFFSSSPNFIERERRARTALKARSMAQTSAESPAAQITSPGTLHDTRDTQNAPQDQPSSESRFSDELPTPARVTNQPFAQDTIGHLSSESTPERPRLTQQRLAPRPSQNDAALFENWEVSSSRAPTERLHVSDPVSDAQPSSPDAIERPSTPENPDESSFEAPTLKPLPGRTMSPSKSCLRSPLKPKTPGRVVEFTSSTLSPLAQGQVRAGAQGKNPTTLGRPPTLSPRRSPRGKENRPSALQSYIHSSPHHKHLGSTQQRQQEEPADSPLSQTKWSKRHWLLMDELLQAYRRNALDFQLRHSDAVMTSPKKRASSSLLGKMVTSQGERMALEQWHLDIVDAFKRDVGGWPEDALAKRLFSLIVGEERRRSGLVPKRR